jgi:L,D-transpeptidase ErfK/SrfK
MSETTFSMENYGRASRPSKPGLSLAARTTILLGILFLLAAVSGLLLFVRADARAGEAVREVVREGRKYREEKQAELAAAAAKKKKKGKKGKATAVAASVTTLPDENTPIEKVRKGNEDLRKKLDGYFPKGPFIVIDTANNRFLMKNGQKVLLDAQCSTGSYSKLDAPDGRSWFFHTPRGQFKVLSKKTKPVWTRPDWDYVEKQEPIPSATHSSRYEPYVMGDYAIGMGDGYFIHGTLYNRLIGQSVTHGCVRLADEPLEMVYNTAEIGTPIFIY